MGLTPIEIRAGNGIIHTTGCHFTHAATRWMPSTAGAAVTLKTSGHTLGRCTETLCHGIAEHLHTVRAHTPLHTTMTMQTEGLADNTTFDSQVDFDLVSLSSCAVY